MVWAGKTRSARLGRVRANSNGGADFCDVVLPCRADLKDLMDDIEARVWLVLIVCSASMAFENKQLVEIV